ncbi:MAG: SOS response-associated peptidase family protein [Sphingomonadaceae bacterium]
MCNLYRMKRATAEVAHWFAVTDEMSGANLAAEVYPGYPGAVVADGALRRMSWGFPLAMKGAKGQTLKPRPVNNTRSDKLDSYMWRYSFAERRCLIPLTAWAEAEGQMGAKTRTWLSLPGQELFAAAGIWRGSDEWGDVYSMVMTDSAGAAAEVHSRMPVLLAQGDWAQWTGGTPAEAKALCVPYTGAVTVERTAERWAK